MSVTILTVDDSPSIRQMIKVAYPAGGNHGDIHRLAHGPREGEIKSDLGAIPIHAGQQNLTRTQRLHFARPVDCIQSGRAPATVGEHFPMTCIRTLGVNRHHDALRTILGRCICDELRIGDR